MMPFLKAVVGRFFKHNGLLLASGLAFDIILCCIPFFFVLISLLGFALSGDRAIAGAEDILEQFLPRAHEVISENLPHIAEQRKFFGLMGLLFFFFSASVAFGSVRSVLATLYEVRQRRNFFIGKGVDLLMMLMVAGLFLLVVAVESGLAVVRGSISHFPTLLEWVQPGSLFLTHLLGFILTWSLLYLIFRISPRQRIGRRALHIACLIGTVLLEVSKWFFAWYVSHAATYAVLYGTLTGVFFFLLWSYYASLVFILSATVAVVIDERH